MIRGLELQNYIVDVGSLLRWLAVRKNINKKQLNATKRSFKDMESLLDHSLYNYIQISVVFEPPINVS